MKQIFSDRGRSSHETFIFSAEKGAAMKLFYLEARKGILRLSVFIALILFLCLDVLKIGLDYRAGAIREVVGNTEGMQAGFAEIYDKVKGPITKETAGFLVDEYQRLSGAVADGTYSREPQDGTYSGYIYGDYFLVGSYFYRQMSYCVQYSERMAERLKQETDNLNVYQSAGNQYMAAKSDYILQHYADRSVSSFYLMDSWESLLAYDFSDLLILLLLVLGIAASFTREKETGMTMLLASSKRGGFPMLAAKCGAAVFYAVGLTMLFSLLNLIVYGVLFDFQGWDCPLYAIMAYENTPFSGTVGQFYLLSCALKALGFSIFSLWLLLLSACFRRTLYPCILGVGVGAAASYLSGWASSSVWWKGMLSAVSPFTLTRASDLWSSLCGDRIGSSFVPRIYIILLIQFVLVCVLLWAVRRKSC